MERMASSAMNAKRARPITMTSKGPLALIFCNVAIDLNDYYFYYFL